jgi:hypothetical protein
MSDATIVTAALELRLVVVDGPSLSVAAHATYSSSDPWAVTVAFHTGDGSHGDVEWMFARQLLTDGITRPVGDGDVQVWPSRTSADRIVNIAMSSPSGAALFEIDRDAVILFLQQTYLAVPTGCESDVVDLDAEIRLLIGD